MTKLEAKAQTLELECFTVPQFLATTFGSFSTWPCEQELVHGADLVLLSLAKLDFCSDWCFLRNLANRLVYEVPSGSG